MKIQVAADSTDRRDLAKMLRITAMRLDQNPEPTGAGDTYDDQQFTWLIIPDDTFHKDQPTDTGKPCENCGNHVPGYLMDGDQ